MGDFDWKNLQLYHWLLLGAGGLVVLALVLFVFTRASRLRIPVIVACSLCSLLAGLAAGVLLLASMGYHWESEQQAAAGAAGRLRTGPSRRTRRGPARRWAARRRPAGWAWTRGRPGVGGRGNGRGPTPKMQLVALVVKLDQLTGKPLTIPLDDAKQAKLRKELAGLEELQDLSDEEAQKRLDSMLVILEKDKPVLEAAGFGAAPGGDRPPANAANPFLAGEQARRRKSSAGAAGWAEGTIVRHRPKQGSHGPTRSRAAGRLIRKMVHDRPRERCKFPEVRLAGLLCHSSTRLWQSIEPERETGPLVRPDTGPRPGKSAQAQGHSGWLSAFAPGRVHCFRPAQRNPWKRQVGHLEGGSQGGRAPFASHNRCYFGRTGGERGREEHAAVFGELLRGSCRLVKDSKSPARERTESRTFDALAFSRFKWTGNTQDRRPVRGLVYSEIDNGHVIAITGMTFGPNAETEYTLLEAAIATFRR